MGDEGKSIDIPNEPKFIDYYKSLINDSPETFYIFDRKDFYTAHGSNAEYLAKSFLNSNQALKLIGNENNSLYSIAISKARYEPLLRFLLIDNNFRVNIYVSKTGKNTNQWTLDTAASPGCLDGLEDILYESKASILHQNVAAIYFNNERDNLVSFVSIDVLECVIYLTSFEDDDSLTLFESLLVRLNPKEFLLPEGKCRERVLTTLRRNNILFNRYKTSVSSEDSINSLLTKLLKPEAIPIKSSIMQKYSSIPLSLIPFQALVDFLHLLNEPFCYSSYLIKEIEIDYYVRLDMSAIVNLHLFPRLNNETGTIVSSNNSADCLYKVLNYCQSPSGRKLLDTIIRQPLTDVDQIETRLNIVEYFVNNTVTSLSFYEHFLPKMPNITKIYKKCINGRCKLQDIYQVYLVVDQLPLMIQAFNDISSDNPITKSVKTEIYDKLVKLRDEFEEFKSLIIKSIDFDHFEQTRELWICANFSDELKSIRTDLDRVQSRADKEFNTVCKDLKRNFSVEGVKMELDKFGFYFRVTKQYAPCIFRSKTYSQIHSASVKDARFSTKQIELINREYVEHYEAYDNMQRKYIQNIVDEARNYKDKFAKLENVLAYIDVMVSFSKASLTPINQYKRPTILPKGSGKIILKQFRHPIIELMKGMSYIPNDICLDKSKFKFFVITGPNMGGKSTLVRSVALSVLMAQIGCFVPCQEAEISVVDGIYTRITASDNPKLGLSTFMSEMTETTAIIRSCTEDSLIVIDELGRSTGIFDGFGIASAIVEHLANTTKSYALFATHFHQLGFSLQDSVGRLYMQCSVDNRTLLNHYKAQPGTSYNSFGIELAKLADIPSQIIEKAESKLQKIKGYGDNIKPGGLLGQVMQSLRNDLEGKQPQSIELVKELLVNIDCKNFTMNN